MQSKRESLTESAVNIVTGVLVSWGMNLLAGPLLGVKMNAAQSAGIVAILTVTSFVRSYAIRRYFNRRTELRLMRKHGPGQTDFS
jgi:hypothetical protein